VIVRLTGKGVEVADDATEHHLSAEAELLNPLDTDERNQLAALLRKLLSRHES
jgi:DNA-binding MarR family transcriptional regulator